MNGNRPRYGSAPLQNVKKRREPAPQRTPSGQTPPTANAPAAFKRRRKDSHTILQMLLSIALPVLFIVTLITQSSLLRWIFIGAAALCVSIMWLRRAFISNARATLSLVYGALVVVTLVALWLSAPPADSTGALTSEEIAAMFSKDTSVSLVNLSSGGEPDDTADTSNAVSQAQLRLTQFMDAWMQVDTPTMLSLCLPSWVSAQESPESSLFQLRANRKPLSYSVEGVSGSEADTSRTVTLTASIDKNNGKDPVTYRFQILMLRVNDVWYVDPSSLGAFESVTDVAVDPAAEEDPVSAAVPTDTPAPTTSPTLLLYYNKDGGKYYHADPNCSSIADKYKPLSASFYYRDLDSTTYKNLLPCTKCSAPKRGQ